MCEARLVLPGKGKRHPEYSLDFSRLRLALRCRFQRCHGHPEVLLTERRDSRLRLRQLQPSINHEWIRGHLLLESCERFIVATRTNRPEGMPRRPWVPTAERTRTRRRAGRLLESPQVARWSIRRDERPRSITPRAPRSSRDRLSARGTLWFPRRGSIAMPRDRLTQLQQSDSAARRPAREGCAPETATGRESAAAPNCSARRRPSALEIYGAECGPHPRRRRRSSVGHIGTKARLDARDPLIPFDETASHRLDSRLKHRPFVPEGAIDRVDRVA